MNFQIMFIRSIHQLFLGLCLVFISCVSAAETSEQKKGRESHEEIARDTHFYMDQKLVDYVQSVGERLAANSSWPDIPYHFFIVDSPDINAFATQGGYVYINRGLLTHLTSEAQMAAVLSHEIAHVTEHHVARTERLVTAGKIGAFLAELITLNADVGDTAQLYAGIKRFGFGREMELEADEVGASILYKTGYDPKAIIEVLSLLKDHQTFLFSASGASSAATYHGLFSSHPRSDQRLREVISQAGELPPGENIEGRDIYREMTEGLIFGENPALLAPEGWKRYTNRSLAITFVYPETWSVEIRGASIISYPIDRSSELILKVESNKNEESAEAALERIFSVGEPDLISALNEEATDPSTAVTAITEEAGDQKRVSATVLGSNIYTFSGEEVSQSELDEEMDQTFLEIMRSFRRATARDLPPEKILHLTYERAAPGETFEEMAAANPVYGPDTATLLRLINGYYPDGNPQPGIWIKKLRE